MTETTREKVFGAIRAALGPGMGAGSELGDFAVQFEAPHHSPGDLVEAFSNEVAALRGTVTVVQDETACAAAIEEFLKARKLGSIAYQTSPLAQTVATKIRECESLRANQTPIDRLEKVDSSLVEATALLADTGSVVVLATHYQDRLLPYLARTCIVVSDIARLHPSLSSNSLASIEGAARSGINGEAVIVTGPSRTADIEKTLVLGAHGPATLAIFLVEGS